jgi:hypothetical protein
VKTQTLTLIAITTSLALSLIATLATYYVASPSDLIILHGGRTDRGWPLSWTTEDWSFWSPPPYPHYFTFHPMNFLIDLIFYAIIFQIPMQIYIHSRRRQKTGASTPTQPSSPTYT